MISIVMPTWNQEKYLQESIDSVLVQTHDDLELIIVDDASTDSTPDILAAQTDPRIRVITRTENGGTGAALNTGFLETYGDMETWVSSDNVMYPNCIETLLLALERKPEVDFVYGNCELWQMDHSGTKVVRKKNILEEVRTQDWDFARLRKNYYLGIFWLWRGELRTRVGGEYQIPPCEDYDMVLRMSEAGGVFEFVPDCLGWFRRHHEGITYRLLRGHKPVHELYDAMIEAKGE